MKPIYWIGLVAVLVLIAIAYWVFDPFGGPTGANTLATTALTHADKKKRMEAVQELGMRKDKTTALPALKRVATETKDPEIKAFALTHIMLFPEKESLPIFFEALKDDDQKVQKAAHDGLLSYFSQTLPGGVVYKVGAPKEEREAAAKKLKEELDKPVAMP